ncbi:DUF2975 domain-containing protein [Sphingopyxis macrogoltabida]|uniref:DUF2975 domain-containing protein n=1 Tax=Sphingopyxis macrogoltabida TaxID=33050 RepID=A0AAC8Z374_SPHMC|nr:DUF2975 domain-containing protein [Sphingopyxis macrogoltabida]ALJ14434.1 hypothetical protein LH19_16305 [Sphingopyxis macrogoltabida]AMU90697.1 hypothetical protein ATM17_16875 [Sphingopyxis macrogoltabida]
MSTASPALLGATRGLLWLFLGLVAVATLLVLTIGVALAFAWPETLAHFKDTGVFLDVASARAPLGFMMLLFLAILLATAFMLRQLQALVASAATGDPFAPTSAQRLRRVGWALVVTQAAALPIHWISSRIVATGSDLGSAGGLSLGGVLAILLAFVLAAVFEQGSAMRDELEGTV